MRRGCLVGLWLLPLATRAFLVAGPPDVMWGRAVVAATRQAPLWVSGCRHLTTRGVSGRSRQRSAVVLYASTSKARKVKEQQPLEEEEPEEEDEEEDEEEGLGGGAGLSDGPERQQLKQLEEEIYQLAGKKFKITSYVELSRVLFEDLKLPVVKQPTNKVLGGYYSTSNTVLTELTSLGHPLPAKILDYRALVYSLRSKMGKQKRKAKAEAAKKEPVAPPAAPVAAKDVRMSPEEKLMMSMLKEESGVDALDRTMVRVGVDIEKVMERVQSIAGGGKVGGAGQLVTESAEFEPEHDELEKPSLTGPLPVLVADEESEGGVTSLYDKGWGKSENFVLIDGTNLLYRAFHAMPRLTTPEGQPIGAVLGFCNILNKILVPAIIQSDWRPYVVVVFDGNEPLQRQTILYPNYKANRGATPDDLAAQFSLAQQATQAFGLINVTAPGGLEADDVIAAFSAIGVEQVENVKVTIVSSDKDFLQLVTDDVTVFDPFNMARIGPQEVFEKYGLEPYQLLDYFSMVGDSADNVPGIPGIGPKTAQELLEEFDTFEELWEFREELESARLRKIIEDNVEQFLMSRRLIHLKKRFDPPKMELMPRSTVAEEKLLAFCEQHALKDLARRVQAQIVKNQAAKDAREEAERAEQEDQLDGDGPW